MSASGSGARPPRRGTVLLVLAVVAGLVAVVHPLRRWVVEPRRQTLLGHRESPGRRLAQASQFGFATASGASIRLVPGRPVLEVSDLPAQAVTLILGGFRGPYVMWLWVKVEEDKHKKVHFDLIHRYTRIAMLQSDYPQVWTFLAWNLAWNLPVQWQSLERRYQWIRRAIEFLGEGFRKNPHSAEIAADMGRIYSEKLGRSQEAEYYRRRVREEFGRSVFLVAYEWYDLARQVNERHNSLGRGLGRSVMYRQACHNLSYHAKELTQDVYDAFAESVKARADGRDADARKAYETGIRRLDEAIKAWKWAWRDWHDETLRFEKEQIMAMQLEIFRRFRAEAEETTRQLETLRNQLTYENLPDTFQRMQRPKIQ
ncbi:MAG TPA: hypothetical protein VM238_20275 [Phycisphaerae bacterium]|nr:hypothetical protein [Phycisphaerae bacterium]